ncbi:MAG: AbrB/MazE/SpoVT family DNA-binding domain-containing protein [Bacteroidota bacterium]|nr:AbrB/MazE/SpoVT family DNA-binding domain-containing protein [Bacteroidota bacterium]
METKVKKWGNSLGVRIPKSFSTQAGITEGSSMEISIDGDKITIAPKHKNEYSIDELISLISEDNVHYEIKTDGPIGNEIW